MHYGLTGNGGGYDAHDDESGLLNTFIQFTSCNTTALAKSQNLGSAKREIPVPLTKNAAVSWTQNEGRRNVTNGCVTVRRPPFLGQKTASKKNHRKI